MVCVVVLSRQFNINPDNVATPIAASLGDLTTISLLAALARGLYSLVDMSSCVDTTCSKFVLCYLCMFHVCILCAPSAFLLCKSFIFEHHFEQNKNINVNSVNWVSAVDLI